MYEEKKGETIEQPFWYTSPAPPHLPGFAVYWPNGHWFQLLMDFLLC